MSSAETEGEPHSLWEENTATVVAAGQSETCTQGTDASPAQPSLRGYLLLHQRLGAEMWGLESRPRQRTAVVCEETS